MADSRPVTSPDGPSSPEATLSWLRLAISPALALSPAPILPHSQKSPPVHSPYCHKQFRTYPANLCNLLFHMRVQALASIVKLSPFQNVILADNRSGAYPYQTVASTVIGTGSDVVTFFAQSFLSTCPSFIGLDDVSVRVVPGPIAGAGLPG